VNVLIDSHVLIWSYFDEQKLNRVAAATLADPANQVLVSAASLWEIAIKISVGKLQLSEPFEDFVQHGVADNGVPIIPIEPRHAAEVIGLPQHHRDPFDRMIVAQALIEKLPVVSSDSVLDKYGIQRIW
jgi:PIN domain nuclease of toxin-antitoxin system